MQIAVNGMPFIVTLVWCRETAAIIAEIVDDAFAFGIQRAEVQDIDGVAALVARYAGVAPGAGDLDEVALHLDEMLQDQLIRGADTGINPLPEQRATG